MSQLVLHEGVVESISDTKIFVSIISKSACASCHSKGMCSVSEMSEKIIEVPKEDNQKYTPGQKVNVSLTKKNGNFAVLFGYLIPFLLLIITLLVTSAFFNELLSGLMAIGILLPYYLILYLLRNRLAGQFEFRIS